MSLEVLETYRHFTEDVSLNDRVVRSEVRTGIRQLDGFTDIHHHLPRLRAAAHGNILEIGVRFGISTAALLLGVEERGGHVYSVDMGNCEVFQHPQWTFIRGDSVSDYRKIKQWLPDRFDLAFIDGDHSYLSVLSDLNNYGRRSRVVMLHDAKHPDVSAAINDFKAASRYQLLELYEDSHGLAVLVESSSGGNGMQSSC